MVTSSVLRLSVVALSAMVVAQGCSSNGSAGRRDAAAGTGGAPVTGGTPGSGGVSGSGGALGSGGAKPGTGGSTGGWGGGGGVFSTGGAGGGTAGGTGGGPGSDGGANACACAGGKTTFDCLCSVVSCTMTLASFVPDAGSGSGYSTLEEYASCNLVVLSIAASISGGQYVFDRTTGALVGRSLESDVLARCPFGDDSSAYRTLSAGRFPDSTCVRSRCQQGSLPAVRTCPDEGI